MSRLLTSHAPTRAILIGIGLGIAASISMLTIPKMPSKLQLATDHCTARKGIYSVEGGYCSLDLFLLIDMRSQGAAICIGCPDTKERIARTRELLAKGIDIEEKNEHGDTALYYAVYRFGDFVTAKILLEHGADPNVGGGKIITAAITRSNIALVKLLIKHGADVNAKTPINPLTVAAMNNNAQMMRLLLDCGASRAKPQEYVQRVIKHDRGRFLDSHLRKPKFFPSDRRDFKSAKQLEKSLLTYRANKKNCR